MKYFGYQKGVGGTAVPVLWHDTPTDGNGKELTTGIFYKIPLSEEDVNLTFEQLKVKYPFKGNDSDAKSGI